jgi:hypothetical protein
MSVSLLYNKIFKLDNIWIQLIYRYFFLFLKFQKYFRIHLNYSIKLSKHHCQMSGDPSSKRYIIGKQTSYKIAINISNSIIRKQKGWKQSIFFLQLSLLLSPLSISLPSLLSSIIWALKIEIIWGMRK